MLLNSVLRVWFGFVVCLGLISVCVSVRACACPCVSVRVCAHVCARMSVCVHVCAAAHVSSLFCESPSILEAGSL